LSIRFDGSPGKTRRDRTPDAATGQHGEPDGDGNADHHANRDSESDPHNDPDTHTDGDAHGDAHSDAEPDADRTPTPSPASRFVDNGDGTITDTQTGLIWEKKDDAGGVHDMHSKFTWAGQCSFSSAFCQPDAASAAACSAATDGALGCALCGIGEGSCNVDPWGFGASTTIWSWLLQLSGFAGHSDWRIPTLAELHTIVGGVPPAFNNSCAPGCTVTTCSCTASSYYWSATTQADSPDGAFIVEFGSPGSGSSTKSGGFVVRAVR
jgi:hypothetical protein